MANSAPDVDFPEQVQALEAAATPIMPDFNLINGGRFPNVLQDFFWDQVELRLNQNQGLVIAYILAETAA